MDAIPRSLRVVFGALLLVLPLGTMTRGWIADNRPAAPAPAPTTTILFSIDQKDGSYERFQISLDETGRGKFEAKPRDGELIKREFEVGQETLERLLSSFDAAQFLSSTQDYESHLKVANTGLKTIVFEQNGRSREVHFNYTLDKHVAAIADMMTGLITTELRINELETAMKYDKLGLPNQLDALQTELKNHWIEDPRQLIPFLTKIANNQAYFNMVQRKAKELILQIESAKRAKSK